jgi:hypothetical protein
MGTISFMSAPAKNANVNVYNPNNLPAKAFCDPVKIIAPMDLSLSNLTI